MDEVTVVDATAPNEFSTNLPAAAGEFIGFPCGHHVWHAAGAHVTPSDVIPGCCWCTYCGIFETPSGALAFGIGAAPWLPAGWLDVGLAPLNVTLRHAFIFCRVLATYTACHSRRPSEPFAGTLPMVVNARLLARKFLDPSDLPRLPSGEPRHPRAIDHIDGVGARLQARLDSERKNPNRPVPGARARWSEPRSPAQWAKVYNMSAATVVKLFEEGTVKSMRLSSKSYMVSLDHLPASYQDPKRGATR